MNETYARRLSHVFVFFRRNYLIRKLIIFTEFTATERCTPDASINTQPKNKKKKEMNTKQIKKRSRTFAAVMTTEIEAKKKEKLNKWQRHTHGGSNVCALVSSRLELRPSSVIFDMKLFIYNSYFICRHLSLSKFV